MTDKFQTNLTDKTVEFLNGVESKLRGGTNGNDGLEAQLKEAVRVTNQAQHRAVLNCIGVQEKR